MERWTKKKILLFSLIFFLVPSFVHAAVTVCTPKTGCTGIGSEGVTTTDIGSVLTVSSSNPFQYKLVPTSTLGITIAETDPIWSAFLLNPIFTNLTSTNFFATSGVFNALTLNSSTPLYLTASSTGVLDVALDNGGYGRVHSGLDFRGVTADRVFTLPDFDGTLAVVDRDGQHFTGYQYFDAGISTLGGLEMAGGQIIFANDGRIASVVPNQVSIGQGLDPGLGEVYANLNTDLINTVSREFTFPDADGTFALTSDLGFYLPLTGGTLTGGLIFTTASGTSITSTNAFFTDLGTTNFSATNGSFTNLTTTNFAFTNASGTAITTTQLRVNNIARAQYYYFTDNTSAFFSTDVGGIVFNGGYGYMAGAGTGLYVQNASVFRGALSNDTGASLTLNGGTTGNTQINNTLTFNNATGTSITSTNAYFTNLNLLNLTATNLTSTNANLTNLTFTNATGTTLSSTNAYHTNLYINTSTQLATVSLQGIPTLDLFKAVSSTGAQMFAIKSNGQVVVGPNSLAQTGQLTIETPTTNDVALSFTNGVHYTFQLGRVAGTSGQAFIGGPVGTSLNLRAGGTDRVFILNTNGYVGINSTTPSTQLVVVGTSTFNGAIFQTGLGDCSLDTQTLNYNSTTGLFTCLTDGTGSGGSAEQRVMTSTENYFTFYTSSTAVTGTPWVQFSGGALTVTTNTNFTIVSSTSGVFGSVTTTNLYISGILKDRNASGGLSGDLLISTGTSTVWVSANSMCNPLTTDCSLVDVPTWFIVSGAGGCAENSIIIKDDTTYACDSTDFTWDRTANILNIIGSVSTTDLLVNGGTLTTTNLVVLSSLSLPNDSVTDAMVAGSLTLTGGSINGVPIGATNPSTGVFTSLTTTNFFATNTRFISVTTTNLFATSTVFINATSTNLYISSLSNFAGAMTFTTASGTSITSTNAFFNSLVFTNASGTSITTTNANFTTLNVSASTTMRTSTISGGFFQTGLGDCSAENQTVNYNATSGKFTCLSDDTSGGGGGGGGVNTSTTNYFAYYLSATAVTGTSEVIFSNGALTINTTTNFFKSVEMSSTLRVYDVATFGNAPTGTILFNYTPVNQTSTIQIVIPDPDYFIVGTSVASTLATYSDDITRMLVFSTVAGTGALSLKNSILSPNNTGQNASYNNAGTLQTITAQTLGSTATAVIKGAVTCGGYHYAFVTSTASGSAQGYIKMATSSWQIDISTFAAWRTSTISGTALAPANLGLVGCANGNLYLASSTTTIVPYAITTSTNTLTSGSTITITGAGITLAGTRVNDNGIYANFGSAPFVRKFNFSGTQQYPAGSGRGQAAAAANGPDLFVTQRSYYSAGNSLAGGVLLYKQSF